MDILFIHTPKFLNYYPLFGYFTSVNQMPTGLLGLADIAVQEGRATGVVHLGLERIVNPRFSLGAFLREHRPAMVAVALHFHPQSYDAIKVVQVVRDQLPEAFILMGGYNASFFASEIMEGHPEIDAVLRGEAEHTMRALARDMPSRRSDLSKYPNLTYRNKQAVVESEEMHASTAEELAAVSRTRLELLRHHEIYKKIAQFLWFYRIDDSVETNLKWFYHVNGFPVPMVRGCAFACSYCGGGKKAQQRLSGRKGLTAVPVAHAVAEIHRLERQGIEVFFMEYVPLNDGDEYYLELFARLREMKSAINADIECRNLPSLEFLKAFASTFPDKVVSRLNFSPDTATEAARRGLKTGVPMTDSLLMQRLTEMETLGVASEIYFSAGLPGETGQDHDQLKKFCIDLRTRFSCIQATRVHSIELDPASPMYMEPEKHGLTDTLRTFEDYRRYHSAGESMLGGLGYGMAGGQEDWQKAANYTARVEELICDKFCRAALPSTWKLPGALRPAAEVAIRRACGAANSMHRSRMMRPKWADPFPY